MKPVGDFAHAEFEVMRLAQIMQGQAVDYVKAAFLAEEDLNLNNLTYDRFMKEYEKSRAEGTTDEFDRQLAAILSPVLQMVLSAPQGEQ